MIAAANCLLEGRKEYNSAGKRVPIKIVGCFEVDICCVLANWIWARDLARKEDKEPRVDADPLVQAFGVRSEVSVEWALDETPGFDPKVAFFSCRDT